MGRSSEAKNRKIPKKVKCDEQTDGRADGRTKKSNKRKYKCDSKPLEIGIFGEEKKRGKGGQQIYNDTEKPSNSGRNKIKREKIRREKNTQSKRQRTMAIAGKPRHMSRNAVVAGINVKNNMRPFA